MIARNQDRTKKQGLGLIGKACLAIAMLFTMPLFFTSAAIADERLVCQRTSLDSTGFGKIQHAEHFYPKEIKVSIGAQRAILNLRYTGDVLINKPNGRVRLEFPIKSNGEFKRKLRFSRFTTGKSQLKLLHKTGFKEAGIAKYNCKDA